MINSIYKLSQLFEKLSIRSVMYNPQMHNMLKEEESFSSPEDRLGLPKEYAETKKFDIRYFESLTDPKEVRLYAHRRLQMIGRGSSRAVYIYSPRFAIKIAINEAGVEQNRVESVISRDPKYHEITARVIKSDPDFNWIISELVSPIGIPSEKWRNKEEKEEFSKHSPIPFNTLMQGINPEFWLEHQDLPYSDFIKTSPKADEINKKTELIKNFISDYNLNFTDLNSPSNWGRTADGRTVILDYGFDHDVYTSHYSRSTPKHWEIEPLFEIDKNINARK